MADTRRPSGAGKSTGKPRAKPAAKGKGGAARKPGGKSAGKSRAKPAGKGRGKPHGSRSAGKKPGTKNRGATSRDGRTQEFWAAADARAEEAARAGWGGVARRGTKNLHLDEHADNVDRDRVERDRREAEDPGAEAERAERRERREEIEAERAIRLERLRGEARAAIERGAGDQTRSSRPKGSRPLRREPLPPRPRNTGDPRDGIRLAFGDRKAPPLIGRLSEAGEAFAQERFADARRLLRPLVEGAPDVAEVRELNGLALYRLGQWKPAAKELEAFRTLSGSTEQHPVLADCYRAQRRWADVTELWEELRDSSPSADLVTEGRIVAAGALADQGDVEAAITLLGHSWRRPKRPRPHHLRRAYALADLYEQAGDVPRARDLFGWIARFDASLGDAGSRVAGLRG